MPTLQQKLAKLLRKIRSESYPGTELANMVKLQTKIAEDIDSHDPVEAMALLGYLLKNNYVKIEEDKGIVLNKDNKDDIESLLK